MAQLYQQIGQLTVERDFLQLYYRPTGVDEYDLELMNFIDRQYLETPFYGSRADDGLAENTGMSGQPEAGETPNEAHGDRSRLPTSQYQ